MSEVDLAALNREAQRLSEETWIAPMKARVVVLRARGMDYATIADLLGVSEGTVARYLHDVRDQYEGRSDDVAWLSDHGYADLLNRDE